MLAYANILVYGVGRIEGAMRNINIELEIIEWNPDDARKEKVLKKSFSDLLWTKSNGISTVYAVSQTKNPVRACIEIAERLFKAPISIMPTRWHDDFVGYSDIANYVGMTHEAVRLIATGKRGPGDFPKPRGYIGVATNRSPLWTWAEVSPWFNANYEIKDEEHFPTNDEIIEINAHIAGLRKKYHSKTLVAI